MLQCKPLRLPTKPITRYLYFKKPGALNYNFFTSVNYSVVQSVFEAT